MIAFDLISDLNLESWPSDVDWSALPTSPVCVIAGGISEDADITARFLETLGDTYQATLYIDGDAEHRWQCLRVADNYRCLKTTANSIKDVVFLQDNVVVLNGVAILATNGWWRWDFDPNTDTEQARQWFCDTWHYPNIIADMVQNIADSEARYLAHSIMKLQTHRDIERIVVVTNAVPDFALVSHDTDLVNSYDISVLGNQFLRHAIEADTEKKISHWCVGRFPGHLDSVVDNIHFVSNSRGRPTAKWCQYVYNPRRIEVAS